MIVTIKNKQKTRDHLMTPTIDCNIADYNSTLSALNSFLRRSIPYRNNAIGIAANQVAEKNSIFSIKNSGVWFQYINPKIHAYYGKPYINHEQCLSIPGKKHIYAVERYPKIDVEYYWYCMEEFSHVDMLLTGTDALVFQHEYDHLQGILIKDKQIKKEEIT